MDANNVTELPAETNKSKISKRKKKLCSWVQTQSIIQQRQKKERERRSKWMRPLLPFALVFWTGSNLKEVCGLRRSSIKGQAFSLRTPLRFTIKNQLSLWHARVLGRNWLEWKRSPVLFMSWHRKGPLNTHTHIHTCTHGHASTFMWVTSTNVTSLINGARGWIMWPEQQSTALTRTVLALSLSLVPFILHKCSPYICFGQMDDNNMVGNLLEILITPIKSKQNKKEKWRSCLAEGLSGCLF